MATRHEREAAEYVAALAAEPVYGPTPYLCVCGAEYAQHGGQQHNGGCKATGCKRFRENVVVALAYEAMWADAKRNLARDIDRYFQTARTKSIGKRGEGEWSIGASDAGQCPRKIQYRENPPEDFTPLPESKREAAMGSAIHHAALLARKALYPWREYEERISVPGLDRESAFDEYDAILAKVNDVKTSGEWKWDLIGLDGPPESEWDQVMLYGYALSMMGKPVRTVGIEVVKRADGRSESFNRPYDEDRAKAVLNRLLSYAAALDAGQDLPRTRSGPTDDPLCRRCFARAHCWNMDEAEAQGRSPESWTLVRDDADAQWAIEQYDAARAQASAGKREQEKYRTLLDGLAEGRYGDLLLGWSGGEITDHVPDADARVEQLERFYAMPDTSRPRLVELPWPTKPKRKAKTISVKPVRAAKREREAVTPTAPEVEVEAS